MAISTTCDLKRVKLLTIEQRCKIMDENTPGIELLSLNKQAYSNYLNGTQVYPHYVDIAQYIENEVKNKLNDNSLPLITCEWFYHDDNQKSEIRKASDSTRKLGIFSEDKHRKPQAIGHEKITKLEFLKNETPEEKTAPEPAQIPDEEASTGEPKTPEKIEDITEAQAQIINDAETLGETPDLDDSNFEKLLAADTLPTPDGPATFEKSGLPHTRAESLKKAQNDQKPRPNLDEPDSPLPFPAPENDFPSLTPWSAGVFKIAFLHHGLGGCPFDMMNVSSLLRHYFPKMLIFVSSINEDKTTDSIAKMGERFAREVSTYLSEFPQKAKFELNFIGHSLGGLVIKAALPHLAEYAEYFKTYVSLGTPHMGSDPSKFLVNAGMGILSKFKANESIRELAMADEAGCLVWLSKIKEMQAFKNILLVCNYEDGYIKQESAKALFKNEGKNQPSINEISQNFYKNIKAKNICKIGVLIPDIAQGFDKFVGRRPHVEFLQNQLIERLVFRKVREFFE